MTSALPMIVTQPVNNRSTCKPSGQKAPLQPKEVWANLGDVVTDGDEIYGDGVNIATRLEGLAKPGGICIKRRVRAELRGKLDLDFEDLGADLIRVSPYRPAACEAPHLRRLTHDRTRSYAQSRSKISCKPGGIHTCLIGAKRW